MTPALDFATALARLSAARNDDGEPTLPDRDDLLRSHHPDHAAGATVPLTIGPNRGARCQRELADWLQTDSPVEEADLGGAPIIDTDVLVVGGGGAGCAAALAAAARGAQVLLVTKLRLGDSNTVMAEGGMQASIEPGDSLQKHLQDTLRGGRHAGDPELVAALVEDAPATVRWLIQQGMQFDLNDYGDLLLRRAGGLSAPRLVHCRDYTGLEMMRVLREAVRPHANIEVLENSPVVELLSNETGEHCVGAVLARLDGGRLRIVRARAVILATGGVGRLHLNGFPTSNHLGATADGLVLAYRIGARLRELDSFQYHPTGLAHPAALAGKLVTEGLRAAGVQLRNAEGRRFVPELLHRDVVCAAILRECREGRGVRAPDGGIGVWLDTPALEQTEPGRLAREFPKLLNRAAVVGVDPRREPLLVYPTLHYQNGGVLIDTDGATTVPGLWCAGEASGGVHGRNRLMGNALLEIIAFGRRAGAAAAKAAHARGPKKITLEHVSRLRRALVAAGLPAERKAPALFPPYTHFPVKPWSR